MSEMAGNAGRIAACVPLPLIADADTGYGNELNVVRTVREYEQRGVAGIHIEDQTFPKRCGHLRGKEVIGLEDYLVKIQRTGRHPVPLANLTPSEAFRRFGADEWELEDTAC
ncbi:MAG TPA: isocitrate lyase/PEP mutase family protein [Bryobacteraceae bacterium]